MLIEIEFGFFRYKKQKPPSGLKDCPWRLLIWTFRELLFMTSLRRLEVKIVDLFGNGR